MSWVLAGASLLLAAGWVAFAILYLMGARRLRLLSGELEAEPDPAAGSVAASLAVVVTARDEEAAIEDTVRSLLKQRHPALHVVVVDDRSTDSTPAILARLAASGDRRLDVVRLDTLPDGWLGKCHACHAGAARARGDWILFMDADVTLRRDDLLERTVALAARRGLDHLPVLPDMGRTGLLQAAFLAIFEQTLLLHMRFWEMDRDRRRGGSGVGAFNLMRRAAYERVGGHARVRLEVAEDYKLGMLLKESGARQRLMSGLGLISCPWHRGALRMLRGLEKNLFGATGYSMRTVVWQTALVALFQVGPLALAVASVTRVGEQAGPAPGGLLPWLVQQAALVAALAAASKRLRHSPFVLWLAYPVALALLLGAYWNSAIRTLARGGVRWRDTFYPLSLLRSGVVRPGDGRRDSRPGDRSRRGDGRRGSSPEPPAAGLFEDRL